MNDDPEIRPTGRKPAAFRIDETGQQTESAATKPVRAARRPTAVLATVSIVPDDEDPFIGGSGTDLADEADALTPPPARLRRRRFSFARLAAGAFGIVFSIAVGVWIDDLVRALFERAPWLAWATLALVAIGVLALVVALAREAIAIYRLDAIQSLKRSVEEASSERAAAKARSVTAKVATLLSHQPETAAGRASLAALEGEIVDGPALVDFAEVELLTPLDRAARQLILDASKRVSVVTAVSPRAVVDLAYVAYEAMRLVRAMATLYGGRPGAFGMMRLLRDTIAHLAVTGSIAVGDGLVQQILGHGIAAKLSSRLGEGVINGMMTARIGIAAMDLCRPMPFRALNRPRIGDFVGDLTGASDRTVAAKRRADDRL